MGKHDIIRARRHPLVVFIIYIIITTTTIKLSCFSYTFLWPFPPRPIPIRTFSKPWFNHNAAGCKWNLLKWIGVHAEPIYHPRSRFQVPHCVYESAPAVEAAVPPTTPEITSAVVLGAIIVDIAGAEWYVNVFIPQIRGVQDVAHVPRISGHRERVVLDLVCHTDRAVLCRKPPKSNHQGNQELEPQHVVATADQLVDVV